jgi:hypothetical protein
MLKWEYNNIFEQILKTVKEPYYTKHHVDYYV